MIKYSQMRVNEVYEMFDEPLMFSSHYEGKDYMFYYLQCVRKPSPDGFVRGTEYLSFELTSEDKKDFEDNSRTFLSILLSAIQEGKVYIDRLYYDEDDIHNGEPIDLKGLERAILLEKDDSLKMLNFYRNELSL